MSSSPGSYRLIIMEGGDGVGKTSIGKYLAKSLRASYFSTPPSGFKPIRPYVETLKSYEARLHYYLAGVYDCLDKMLVQLQISDVVCDRFVWSSIIGYLALKEKELECFHVNNTFGLSELVKIEAITILLTVSEKEQIIRIQKRENKGKTDILSINNNDFRKRVNQLYEKIGRIENWLVFDTTGKTVELSCSQLFAKINTLGGIKHEN